ncbi:MAG TPA: branched-chain amino acid ABC transporter substrate-binding protein [Methylomirabilota bacterium]
MSSPFDRFAAPFGIAFLEEGNLRVRSLAASSCLVTALVFGVAACGGNGNDNGGGGGGGASTGRTSLTIYSSLPLQGDSRPQSEDVVNGERLALEEAGGKVGKFTIKYVSLDDATAAAGKWDPGQTSSNARKAAQDPSTIAYLGEFNSGASAISIPILNEANILQISPSNTYVGLTRAKGADKGEPDKYYPAGKRTYGRVVPADHIQAAAQVTYQKDEGCKKTYILNDKEVYGKGIAVQVESIAKTQGLAIAGNDGIDTHAANFRTVAQKIKSSGADCMFFGGITQNKGVQVFTDVNAANPNMKLFGPDGVADVFVTKISSKVAAQTYITNPTLDPKLYPPAAQDFFNKFKEKFGHEPYPYAIYGYEAMKVALLAIQNAGDKGNDRQAVIDAFFKIKDRDSVLGKYSIDENGDTTLSDYGADRVKNKKLVFDKVIKAQTQG